jgi:glycosyltransferase involved in cell wall biosynthesis
MKKKINKIFYIADINLPSLRAYTVHVIKMADNFCHFSNQVELLIHHKKFNYNYRNIKKDFLLLAKNLFFIKGFFKKKKKNNFFNRILFGYLSAKYLRNENGLIITRSFMCSFFLILNKKKHFLEIHHPMNGFTKILFMRFNFITSKYIIRVIFITKSLQKHFKNVHFESIVLPDGAEIKNFKKKKLKSKIKNIMYVGSFFTGRGIELILKIASILKNKNFLLYGKRKNDFINYKYNNLKNVKIFNLIKYNKVPSKLVNADLLLMPYALKNISIDMKKVDTSKFASPIKMFEYLASGKPLISSNLPVLKEILINKNNCLIAKNNSAEEWVKSINLLDRNTLLKKRVAKNGLITAAKYSWFKRANAVVNQYLKYNSIKKNIFKIF